MEVTLKSIEAAAARLQGVIHQTNLTYSTTFSQMSGNQVFLKPENLQRTGSFKIRGAFNKIINLTEEEQQKGVIALSAGNHAQGVALAARIIGVKATIVMPKRAPFAKVTATENYGAEVLLYGEVFDETYDQARKLQLERDLVFVHPFNDSYVISGQGTAALEIFKELPDVDAIIVPIGGGGLISGIAVAAKAIKPSVKIIGVEVDSAASMRTSIKNGEIVTLTEVNTFADGIAVKTPGDLTFQLCQQYVDQIVVVSDEEIARAILLLMERAKLVVEGAGATSLAALLGKKINLQGKKVVPLLTGGNIDYNLISRIIERGLTQAGRKAVIKTAIKDRPGNLQKLLSHIAVLDANITAIDHRPHQPGIPIEEAEVKIELEIRNKKHLQEIGTKLKEIGYEIEMD